MSCISRSNAIREGVPRISTILLCAIALAACTRQNGSDTSGNPDDSTQAAVRAGSGSAADSTAIPLKTPDGKPARFAFRSGHVVMRYEGDFHGTRDLYFDDYGLRERKDDSAVPAHKMIAAVPPQQITIITPEYYGGVDLRSGKGQKARNAAYDRYVGSPESSKIPFGEMALERSGGTRLADTTLLGTYRCRVYRRSYPNFTQTMWVWGGIPIREQMQVVSGMSGNYLLEPVSIETGIEVPDSLFSFPEGYDIKEVPPPAAE